MATQPKPPKKTDYSANSNTAYRYGGSACANKPNALCSLAKLNGTAVSFTYDAKGNLRSGDGLSMTYNAMDKPITITGRGAITGFTYGSDSMRAKQTRDVSGVITTTYYVDKYFEADNDGSWRAYLSDATGDDIAVLSYTPQRSHLLQFTLRDRLGSATTLANQSGVVVSRRYFDPFGRADAAGSSHLNDIVNKTSTSSRLLDLDITNRNRRGFTDHEHLNEQQLIHMNGRVYDYNLGRFMSVDPLIQSPTSTQSINPYSYIMNNPLAGTDPTGYAGCAASRIESTCDRTLGQHGGNGKADASFFGGNKGGGNRSNGSSRQQVSTPANSTQDVSKVGSLEGNAAKSGGSDGGDSTSGKAAASELIGKINKEQLGSESSSSQKNYDEAYKFFKDDISNMGETVEFKDAYAVSIRNAADHSETYAPKTFDNFDDANEYAAKKYGEGYEKVWVFGYHYGGKSTIYKPATFSGGGYTGVQRTIATLAHESRHYNRSNTSFARPHNTPMEHRVFEQVSLQAVDRYNAKLSGEKK